jgi:hypothetical protein
MAQTNTTNLDTGDLFPGTSVQVVGEQAPMNLPADLSAEFTVFLVYRGKW